MSGLAAIIQLDGAPVDRAAIARMVGAMAHKGPDGVASWCGKQAALGHATLHTTGESCEASQPLVSHNSACVVIVDGLLTNWDDLRKDLLDRGVRLRSNADAELILGAYSVWGEECTRHLDGEFAFVLWDERNRSALYARDHQGLRSLFYTQDKNRIVIASDQLTLNAALECRPEPNLDYLAQVASDQFYSREQTAALGVYRALPAHTYRILRGEISKREYWELPTDVTLRYKRDEDYVEHYRSVLSDCVKRASRTHRPLAMEVSGGLDSSATYCIGHQMHASGQLPAPSVLGYTLRGRPGTPADEVKLARAVARFAGGTLREVPLFEPPLEWYSEQAKLEQDLPTFTNGAMSIELERAMVADGCRASVGGTGGDQWLGGTLDYYLQHLRAFELSPFVRALAADTPIFGLRFTVSYAARQVIAALLPLALANRLRRHKAGAPHIHPSELYWLSARSQRSLTDGFEMLTKRYRGDPMKERKRRKLEQARAQLSFDLINRQQSRIHMESRSPMFARAFIEFSATTPEHIRLRAGQTKWVHRQALCGLLPQEVLHRQTKATFPAPELRSAVLELCARERAVLTEALCERPGLARLRTSANTESFDSTLFAYLWGTYASAAYMR